MKIKKNCFERLLLITEKTIINITTELFLQTVFYSFEKTGVFLIVFLRIVHLWLIVFSVWPFFLQVSGVSVFFNIFQDKDCQA
jgi:hypothetical protein